MSHELFVINRQAALDETDQGRVTYLRDQLSIAASLGLNAQLASLQTDIATIERSCLITSPPLTDAELIIWRAWLPTIYTDVDGDKRRKLVNYNFDRIPSPVLKMWQKHKESGAFVRFEIWTPENNRPDPILVGVNGNARHLLARWGESDANLISFDNIKRELVRRWHENEPIDGENFNESESRIERAEKAVSMTVGPTIFLMMIWLMVTFAAQMESLFPFLGGIALIGAIGVGTCAYIRRRLTRQCRATSKLMQAIATDDSVRHELLPASL